MKPPAATLNRLKSITPQSQALPPATTPQRPPAASERETDPASTDGKHSEKELGDAGQETAKQSRATSTNTMADNQAGQSGSNAIPRRIAMIGCGSMGGNMALLFAEKGVGVSLQDPSPEAMDHILSVAGEQGLADRLSKHDDYAGLAASLDDDTEGGGSNNNNNSSSSSSSSGGGGGGGRPPRIFVYSLPHGSVGDSVTDGLAPHLRRGDVVLDCGNEHWRNTQRRQGRSLVRGLRYVGCGVSGGYQAARAGPSMCPGGEASALDAVMPLLELVAARDAAGRPCVGRVGTGGCGHYVKMVHNGIEHGMMSAIAEAWRVMHKGLGMGFDDIADVLEQWNRDGPLRGTFLVDIGVRVCRAKDGDNERVLDQVQDKVVQDITGEEGTGIWSNEEAISHHIPAPTLTAAHYFRLASADRDQRLRASKTSRLDLRSEQLKVQDRAAFIEDLRWATYVACLVSFVQGVNVIEQADRENGWGINYAAVLQIWRGGCIIQADHISELLRPVFEDYRNRDTMNLLFEEKVMDEVRQGLPALKNVVLQAVDGNHPVPAISSALEYVKFETGTDLPTSFYEAELDLFGKHMYDKKGEEGTGGPTEGKHHFEWKPQKGAA